MPHVANSSYQRCLFMAMFIIAFYAFLRVGEITVRSHSNPNLLLLSNVSFKTIAKASCMIITMTNFKHNLGENPVHLEFKAQPIRRFCPVQIMKNYLKVRSVKDGPLFCYGSGRPISRSEFCKVLNSALKFSKLDSHKFKAHSFRKNRSGNSGSPTGLLRLTKKIDGKMALRVISEIYQSVRVSNIVVSISQ